MSYRVDCGQRRVRVTPEFFEAVMLEERIIKTNLPDDARFVRMYPDEKGGYWFVFESKGWEGLREGEPIPEFDDIVAEESTLTFKIQ